MPAGEHDRIVGISVYDMRPLQARRKKPRVSALAGTWMRSSPAAGPVLTFSDLDADIATVSRRGTEAHAFNQPFL